MATILTKRSNTASSVPLAADLTNSTSGAELAVNTADKRLFSKDSGGTVVELGTNPSSLALPSGSANGVAYLNGSKVLTTGSALTFDGSNLGIGRNPTTARLILQQNVSGATVHQQIENVTNNTLIQLGSDVGLNIFDSNRASSAGGIPLAFQLGGSEQMRLTSTGLGIGTSSPAGKLSVISGSTSTATNVIVGTVDSRAWAIRAEANDGIGYSLRIGPSFANGYGRHLIFATGDSDTERMRLDSSGNLGLGVTPSAWNSALKAMEIGAAGVSVISTPSGGNLTLAGNAYFNTSSSWIYGQNGYASRYAVRGSDGQHQWFTAPSGTAGNAISFTQAMTLDASGNLLVGTTSTDPIGARVNGSLINAPSGSFQSRFNAGSFKLGINTSSGNSILFFTDNGSSYVSAGTISSNGSSTAYNTSSDYRLKENVVELTGALAKVSQLRPVEWTWKEGFGGNSTTGQGFIAHELAEVVPQCVTGEKDAVDAEGKPVYQGIDTSFLVATLTAAIQELNAKVESLQSELNSLKGA